MEDLSIKDLSKIELCDSLEFRNGNSIVEFYFENTEDVFNAEIYREGIQYFFVCYGKLDVARQNIVLDLVGNNDVNKEEIRKEFVLVDKDYNIVKNIVLDYGKKVYGFNEDEMFENQMELRRKKIQYFTSLVDVEKIKKDVESICIGDVRDFSDSFKINNVIVGYIVPKDKNEVDLDFDRTNVKLITMDLEIERDLNYEKLICRVGFNTLELIDTNGFDEEEYVENYLDDMGKEYVYDMLESYDCKRSELAEVLLDDEGIENIIGDCYSIFVGNNEMLLRWYSSQDLSSIKEDIEDDIERGRTEKEIVWFNDNGKLIEEILSKEFYKNFKYKNLENKDLEMLAEYFGKLTDYGTNDIVEKIINEIGYEF